MTTRYEEMIRELTQERKDYEAAEASLTPSQLAQWWKVYEANEYFDGEYGIALAYLTHYLERGNLGK